MSDRYEIQEKIGQGGIGAVYRAYDTQLKRSVAIKRMLPSEDADPNGPTSAEMILKEATTLSALQHPNIITVYDVGLDDEGAFVVMELLKGETLDQVVQRGVLTLKDFCEVVSQSMEALIAAEAAGVLHRDLKPTNVMVNWLPSKKFQVKILDFSLAKFSRTPAPQTIDQGDAIFGSIYFMAPEQFERGNLDKRTDLYSMGCLYYYCLTGQYPFQGESAAQVMASHLQGTVIPLDQIRADLPPVICQWVMWLINRYAKDRPDDAREAFENFQLLVEAINPNTNRIAVSGLQADPALTSTSRRLIVPPPRKTTSVNPLPKGAVASTEESAHTRSLTSAVTALPRSENRLTYWWVFLSVLMLVLLGLGAAAFVRKGANEEAVKRFQMVVQDPSLCTPNDVPLIVSYLDSGNHETVASASYALQRLSQSEEDRAAFDDAITAALKTTKSTQAQQTLIATIHFRGIDDTEALLLTMTTDDRHPNVILEAFEALGKGKRGGDQAFQDIISHFHFSQGSEAALKAIGQRLEDKESASQSVVDQLDNHRGIAGYALMRVLGSLGTKTALSTLEKMILPAPDAPSDFNERRLAALQALQEWPQRSADVTSVLERAMDRAEVGPERARAVETYIHLLFVQGNTPTEAHMVKQLLYILENDDSDLHRARKEFIGSLSRLQDRELALKTAEQLLKSTLLPPTSKEDAAKEFAEMTPTDSR